MLRSIIERRMVGMFMLLIAVCLSANVVHARVKWTRVLDLSTHGSLYNDTISSERTLNWKLGVGINSNFVYGARSAEFSQGLTTIYEETTSSMTKTIGQDYTILNLIYRRYLSRFTYWTISTSNWAQTSKIGGTILNATYLGFGWVISPKVSTEYTFATMKFLTSSDPATNYLTAQMTVGTTIGWRRRSSIWSQFTFQPELKDLSHIKATLGVKYLYSLTVRKKIDIQVSDTSSYDNKPGQNINNANVDLVFTFY